MGRRGPRVTAIDQSGDFDAQAAFEAAVNAEISRRVAEGQSVMEAFAGYDPEEIAASIAYTSEIEAEIAEALDEALTGPVRGLLGLDLADDVDQRSRPGRR